MNLYNLPQELLVHILTYLRADDVVHMSLVCRKFNDLSYLEKIWRLFCYRDYEIRLSLDTTFTARNLYLKVLKKYGSIVGLWQSSIKHYGSMVQIQYSDGILEAFELFTPFFSGWRDPLKKKLLFRVELSQSQEKAQIISAKGHDGKITFLRGRDLFNFKLVNVEKPTQAASLNTQEKDFKTWLKEQGYGPGINGYSEDNPADLLSKFLVLRSYEYSCTFKRLQWPSVTTGFPILPGLFRSRYSSHGPELFMLSYADEGPKATVIKITGDPNIPASKITFFCNLNKSLHNVTWDDQADYSSLTEVQAVDVPYSSEAFLSHPPQVFRLPEDNFDDNDEFVEPVPEISIGRFLGYCQLADHGYKDPYFSKGHWVIFDHDTFGFIFLELFCMSIYYRVVDPQHH